MEGKNSTVLLLAIGAALVIDGTSARANTLLQFDGLPDNNSAIRMPASYGDNVSASSTGIVATAGVAGVIGTPGIVLGWNAEDNPTGPQWDSYTNWDGRGPVVQTDYRSAPLALTFTPTPTVGVLIHSFVLDEYTGGGASVVNWSINNGPTVIVSGTWNDFAVADGGRSTVVTGMTQAQALANIGSTLTLHLTLTGGTSSYQAMDDLNFDQVRSPTPAVLPRKTSFTPSEPIVIDFSGGPAKPKDWIAIFTKGIVPGTGVNSLKWCYTNGSTTTPATGYAAGSVTFPAGSVSAGTYSLWFLENDGYTPIAGPTDLIIAGVNTGPPKWVVSPFRLRHAIVATAYTGKISAYASDPDGSTPTFSKISGPAWLSVSTGGNLTGTPGQANAGKNIFVLRASDGAGSADATLTIQVFKAGTEEIPELKVLSYNLWHGWGQINDGHRKGIESVILSDADIVGTQETVDNVSGSNIYQAQRIAEQLGWYYGPSTAGDMGIVSRYPITANLTADIAKGVRIRVATSPVRDVILYNAHLNYTNYGPYAARLAGATAASVLTEELKSYRDEQIAAIMPAMAANLANADDVPVLLTGDFNAPSHLDWTPATAADHGGVSGVAWPASTAVENAGMLDSFRVIHPDPAAERGYTWSPLYLGDPPDRIDFIYYKGASLLPVESRMFHTPIETTLGAWGASTTPVKNNTWPSDHGAMLTVFRLKPVDTDGDNLSDAWEIEHFGNLGQSATSDADGDGRSNLVEQMAGSSPLIRDEDPWLILDAPDTLHFSLSEAAYGFGWLCERSESLTGWTTVWSYRSDSNLLSPRLQKSPDGVGKWQLTLVDPAPSAPARFYRFRTSE